MLVDTVPVPGAHGYCVKDLKTLLYRLNVGSSRVLDFPTNEPIPRLPTLPGQTRDIELPNHPRNAFMATTDR